MVSSTVHAVRRRSFHALAVTCLTATMCLTGAVTAPAWSVPGATARRCPTTPVPATIISDIPWPQQRYDLRALSQITDGAAVTVAVVDSGVDAVHPQLVGAVRSGADVLDPGGDGRQDCVGHGTAVASIIAGRPAKAAGLRGLAPGAMIMPVRVSERVETDGSATGLGDVSDLADGIRAAARARPRPGVINLSISTTGDDPALRTAVREALDADIVIVAAVGNRHDRGDPTPYPAAYPGVVGVGAADRDGRRAAASQTGSYVDITAPGDAVIGAAPGRGHVTVSGTSFATPFVAATAALIRARWPALRQAEVVRRLLATADPAPGGRVEYGYGVLNPMRAVTEVVPPAGEHRAAPAPRFTHPPVAGGTTVSAGAVGAAGLMIAGAAAVAIVAAAIPLGRRRRWRPGAPPS